MDKRPRAGSVFILAILILCRCATAKAEGTYVHAASGMTFPVSAAGFTRSSVKQYDDKGLDVSGGYDLLEPLRPIAATVYVYPSPRLISIMSPRETTEAARGILAQRHFEGVKAAIIEGHPEARLVTERDVTLEVGKAAYHGKMATFEYTAASGGVRQDYLTHVYLFDRVDEKWAVKYRFTHPKLVDGSLEIDALMRSVPWQKAGP